MSLGSFEHEISGALYRDHGQKKTNDMGLVLKGPQPYELPVAWRQAKLQEDQSGPERGCPF